MILFDEVIEVFPPHHLDRDQTTKAFEHRIDHLYAGSIGAAFVDDDLSRNAVDLQHLGEELCGGRFIATSRKHEITRFAVFVDGSIEINPQALHLDINFTIRQDRSHDPFRHRAASAMVPEYRVTQRFSVV